MRANTRFTKITYMAHENKPRAVPAGREAELDVPAAVLVKQADNEDVELTGSSGLLTGLVQWVLQSALESKTTGHLRYTRHDSATWAILCKICCSNPDKAHCWVYILAGVVGYCNPYFSAEFFQNGRLIRGDHSWFCCKGFVLASVVAACSTIPGNSVVSWLRMRIVSGLRSTLYSD